MRGKIFRIVASYLLAGTFANVPARANEDFSGAYTGDTLALRITPDSHAFVGEIRMGQQHFPLKAHEEAGRLVGSFSTPDANFDFTATLDGKSLNLTSGGTTYVLNKTAVNPLLAVHPDHPAPNAAEPRGDPVAASDALAGYTTVTATDFGKALTADKPDVADVTSAFQATFPDLARHFGARPTIVGVVEDTKDHATSASFTARLNGQPINGFVSCKMAQKGAVVHIVYCRADAPKAEWSKLIAQPVADKDAPARAAANIKLRAYQFPDGTGSVGVAEGWTTHSPSLMTGVEIKGPADQEVNLAFGASISTPDGPLVQMHAQLEANARQWNMPPPAPLPVSLMIAPYTDPVTSLKELCPQFSRISQSNGGPALALDQILSVEKTTPMLPGGQAAVIIFDMTKTRQGVSKHYRSGIRWEMTPITPGGWMLLTSQALAPKETYDRDWPAMLAMAASLKENPQVIMEKTRISIEAANERFAASQRANKELQEAFAAQHRSWEHNQLIQSRSFADFDEVIIGSRTVQDTATGYRTSVDLGNSHEIVDRMNRYEPGRYKEVPLRDEMYPLPGR